MFDFKSSTDYDFKSTFMKGGIKIEKCSDLTASCWIYRKEKKAEHQSLRFFIKPHLQPPKYLPSKKPPPPSKKGAGIRLERGATQGKY